MTRIDLHPEDLFDRLRAGRATALERERLHSHLKSCSACRLEQALLGDADEAARAPEAAEIAERAGRRALAQLVAQRRGFSARSKHPRAGGRPSLLIAAALIAACFAAVAIGRTRARLFGPHSAPLTNPSAVLARPAAAMPSAPEANPASALGSAEQQPGDAELGTGKPASAAARSVNPPGASELFARANQARRQGKAREAATLYRDLERAFPKSAEANVARVSFGRLLLDRLGEPRTALDEFDAYLSGGGALREEALIGRALALGRLGRSKEEKASWSALLAAFPRSTYAERAKERVSELD